MIIAQPGNESIEKVRAVLPDTILLDMRMTETDGFEVCRTLKSDKNTKHIPVIMITASKTDPKDHIRGLETGAGAYFSQSFDDDEEATKYTSMLTVQEVASLLRISRFSVYNLIKRGTYQP